MKYQRLTKECIHCLISKFSKINAENNNPELEMEYLQKFLKILSSAKPEQSAPELVEEISKLHKDLFGISDSFSDLKKHFNNLLLSMEDEIKANVKKSENRLKTAVKYAMMGNYIDFGAVDNVNEETLFEHINNAENIEINKEEFSIFENELSKAGKLVFLTDNCGEIVFDKILIETVKELYPSLEIKVIVRGFPVLNDVTMEDVSEVGLDKIVPVFDNGSQVAGTCLHKISQTARDIIDQADIIISKGQGNFETLRGAEKNIYYIFMCKCELFAKRFKVPVFSGMFINDLRME